MKFLAAPIFLAGTLVGTGCSSNTTPPPPPLPACSAAIPSPEPALTTASGASACSDGTVVFATAGDLAVDGYRTLSPAFAVGRDPSQPAPPHGIDVVLPFDKSDLDPSLDANIVVLVQKGNAPAHAAMVSNLVVEPAYGKVHFHVPDAGTFQLGIRSDAGRMVTRHFTFRAIAGPSMGGFGSSVNFWLHPDRYDAIGVMGADPGPDMTYTLGMIRDYFVGGFCTAADGLAKIGQLCPTKRQPLTDQLEVPSDFEHFPYQPGEGVGLTLSRSLFLKANRDLSRAMGNPAVYNPDSPYLPPGAPASYLQLSPADQCAKPVKLKQFFDGRYNPQGTFDVITFCDGNDSMSLGLGVFDPSLPETNPAQVVLAVDVNGNGKRDSGEPVIVQQGEPFDDVGTDGLPDEKEPGYDPVNNPDPNGDDYHYLWNPTGTEKNWRYDAGEPFVDSGIDGVKGAGCPYDPQNNCWDYGEGNGQYDYSPGYANWRKHDPRTNLEALDPSMFDRVDVYYDAGIRDFFNAQVSTNSLMGALTVAKQEVRAWDGFPAIIGQAQSKEMIYDVNKIDFTTMGRHMYVRYGDPDLTPMQVLETGDGRHVGSAVQAVHRAQTLLYWLAWRWPDGDRSIPKDTSAPTENHTLMMDDGRMSPYVVVLPPGYNSPDQANVRYPVVYLGHGLGMHPADLASVTIIAQNAMVDAHTPEAQRMPKFITVLLDGACTPGGDVTQAPLDPSTDLCEEGAFYTDHPEGWYRGETMILQLQDQIDAMYRTRAPADVMVKE